MDNKEKKCRSCGATDKLIPVRSIDENGSIYEEYECLKYNSERNSDEEE
jgi:hypothetical protein